MNEHVPETRIGLQHGTRIWRSEVFRTIQKYSGRRTASRPGGGAYTDDWPVGFAAECVQKSSPGDLRKYLTGDLILCGAAVAELQKRGLDGLIGNVGAELMTDAALDVNMEHPLCAGIGGLKFRSFGEKTYRFRHADSPEFQVLTRYRDKDDRDFGAGALLYTRPDGTRVAFVSGFNVRFLPTSRVILLNRIADWVSHGTLPVLTAEPRQLMLIPRIAGKGTLRSVTVLNPTIGPQNSIALLLRNVPVSVRSAKWIVPASAPVELPLERGGAGTRVVIPSLAAWDVGYLEF